MKRYNIRNDKAAQGYCFHWVDIDDNGEFVLAEEALAEIKRLTNDASRACSEFWENEKLLREKEAEIDRLNSIIESAAISIENNRDYDALEILRIETNRRKNQKRG
jgi:hypothetical protein